MVAGPIRPRAPVMRAATPDTWAVAIEEPESQVQPPPSVVEMMSVPGADRSMCRPGVENDATAPLSPTAEIPSTPGWPAG